MVSAHRSGAEVVGAAERVLLDGQLKPWVAGLLTGAGGGKPEKSSF